MQGSALEIRCYGSAAEYKRAGSATNALRGELLVMAGLYEIMQWMAETVHTGDWMNEWYYQLIQHDSVADLLEYVGTALVEIFS